MLKPSVYYPCNIFKDSNLFLLSELLGGTVTVVGNVLSVVGSFSSQATVNVVGVIFATMNLIFSVLFAVSYGKDMKKTTYKVVPQGTRESEDGTLVSMTKTKSAREVIGKSVLAAEQEFSDLMNLIKSAGSTEAKQKLIDGLPFLGSQVLSSIKIELHSIEEKKSTTQEARRKFVEFENIFSRLEENFKEVTEGELSSLNQQRMFWSYLFSLNLPENFSKVAEEYFGKEEEVLQDLKHKHGGETSIKTWDEIIKDSKLKTGWTRDTKTLGYIECLCVGLGYQHCLIEIGTDNSARGDQPRASRVSGFTSKLGLDAKKSGKISNNDFNTTRKSVHKVLFCVKVYSIGTFIYGTYMTIFHSSAFYLMICIPGFLLWFGLRKAEKETKSLLKGMVKEWLTDKNKAQQKYGHMSDWDVSEITDMKGLFKDAYDFNEDLSQWDTSKCTNMSDMFLGCTKFNSDLSRWDTSKCKSMVWMFGECSSLSCDLRNWNVSQCKDMSYMFYDAPKMTEAKRPKKKE